MIASNAKNLALIAAVVLCSFIMTAAASPDSNDLHQLQKRAVRVNKNILF
jgi:hypothetical protein